MITHIHIQHKSRPHSEDDLRFLHKHGTLMTMRTQELNRLPVNGSVCMQN
jgi:hypothetical protein